MNCDDLLPGDVPYSQISALMTDLGGKGCARCHNTQEPIRGLNFEGPAVSWDSLTTRVQVIYPQLSSGRMPEGGDPWTDEDLQLLRTWYCSGGSYE